MVGRARRHVRHNFVGYLALVVALGGTSAFAATSLVGSGGKVNGCVKKKGKAKGTLRVVAPGKRCKRSERAIAWNQRGEPGPAGERGSTGPRGARGAPGSPGSPGSPDTPSQVLAKLLQVDGDGSALDADLLDGHETAFFQRRGTTTACSAGNKVTEIAATGDVTCAADATAPTGAAGGDLDGSYPSPTLREPEGVHFVTAAAFQNGWTNLDTDFWMGVNYYKDRQDRVHIEGLLSTTGKSGTSTVFTLPAGYRPCSTEASGGTNGGRIFVTQSGSGVARVDVLQNGKVDAVSYTTNSHLSLSGISFRATPDCVYPSTP